MKKKNTVPLRIIKEGVLPFLIIFFVSFYSCENVDDTMPADDIVTTRSYDHFTDEQWEIVRLMPNIKSVKWETIYNSNTPPDLIVEVEAAYASKEFMQNGCHCFIELGGSDSFNENDPLLEYAPCYIQELYSAELDYPSIILKIPPAELGDAKYIAVRSKFAKDTDPYYGAIYTDEILSLWNPYATMMGFDKRFPRPAYIDSSPMHISLAVQFEASNEDQYCEIYIGTNSTPVASAWCEASEYPITKYVTFDWCNSNNIELAYAVRGRPVTVFYTVPYKTNIISLVFRVPVAHSYEHKTATSI